MEWDIQADLKVLQMIAMATKAAVDLRELFGVATLIVILMCFKKKITNNYFR